ncbi:MAG: trypsin-like peptidase domain-containing protein [Planctomycetes bacterium]|nr:trypsin-like peptidase domain-containing protein [Planctomycetota bacterium]
MTTARPLAAAATPLALLAAFAHLAEPASAQDHRQGRVTPIVQVARDASPAVAYIQTGGEKAVGMNIWGRIVTQQFTGSGSGVVIHKEGFLITNFHVVKDADQITVNFDREHDPQQYRAQLVSFVEEEDLALLKIDGDRDFPVIPLGTSADLMLGETVIAIGNPYGQTHTVTQGIISGLHRNVQIPAARLAFDDLIQTDAGINPGNSGGPLLNIYGELIGINSAMNFQAQNIGFAIPIDRVKTVLEEQLLSPQSASAWLGFEVDPADQHIQIREVVPGSPAHAAGLRAGDCIVALGGQRVASPDEYRLARVGLAPAREVEFQVERAGESRRVRLAPWDKIDGLLYQHLGLRVEQRSGRGGAAVVISDVRTGGPAARLGLKPGDVLDAVRLTGSLRRQSWRIDSRESFARLVQQFAPGTEIEVAIYRDADGDGRLTRNDEHRGTLIVD